MMVCSFDECQPSQTSLTGGKGGTLIKLYQRGYPVPNGFIILPEAFDGDNLRPAAWDQVQLNLERLRTQGASAFAVRSSALSEDTAEASFAGEFETVLDVRADDEVRNAILAVRGRDTPNVCKPTAGPKAWQPIMRWPWWCNAWCERR